MYHAVIKIGLMVANVQKTENYLLTNIIAVCYNSNSMFSNKIGYNKIGHIISYHLKWF